MTAWIIENYDWGAFLTWALVVALLASRFLVAQVQTARMVRRATPIDREHLGPDLEELELRTGLSTLVRFHLSDEISSPAVWGLVRPRVLLPSELVRALDPTALRWVLLHELAHVRRADLAIGFVQRALQIVWFFHPGAWIANRLVDELRECACDESALAASQALPEAGTPDPFVALRRECAAALLSIAEHAALRPASALAVQTLFPTRSLLERRMMRLLDSRRTAHARLPLLALPPLLLGAGAALASPQLVSEDAGGPGPDPVATAPAAQEQRDEARRALDRALTYLIESQREDGAFQAGRAAEVLSSGEFDPAGITGLAVLALLQAAERDPETVRDPLAKAIAYLEGAQDADSGCFGDRSGPLFVPSHAVATLAWIEAHADSEGDAWHAVANRAIGFLRAAQNPYAAWRYDAPPVGDNDAFVTGLALRALETAKRAGLEVSEQSLRNGWSFIEQVQDPATGRTGYSQRGEPVSRLAGKKDDFPREESEMVTSVVLLARYARGDGIMDSEEVYDGVRLVSRLTPVWSRGRGTIDYYHWAFGTAVLAPLGGKIWERWRADLFEVLLTHQEDDGSWAPVDAWSAEGSDVHATLMCVLALQAAGA